MTIGNFGAMARFLFACAALLLGVQAAAAQPAQKGYRIHISVDMEGLTGAVSPNQIIGNGNDYAATRKVMVGEILAAIEGAREAGATEFVIADSHGGMENILIDELPEDVTLIRGQGRPLGMMEGIDRGHYDGAMFIGYHASASNMRGVRAHTIASARFSEVKLNGVAASEGYINAAVAGENNVPILLVTGDDATVEELGFLKAEGVAVKRAIGFHAAESMTPAAARKRIREASRLAVSKIGSHKPFKIAGPVNLDVMFHYYRPAEMLSWLPIVERIGPRTIRFKGKTVSEATKILGFANGYNVELEP